MYYVAYRTAVNHPVALSTQSLWTQSKTILILYITLKTKITNFYDTL